MSWELWNVPEAFPFISKQRTKIIRLFFYFLEGHPRPACLRSFRFAVYLFDSRLKLSTSSSCDLGSRGLLAYSNSIN